MASFEEERTLAEYENLFATGGSLYGGNTGSHPSDEFEFDDDLLIPTLFPLTVKEANAIDRLTEITEIDCWFWLVEEKEGMYYVHDLENNENLQLDVALGQALDGFGSKENLISLGATEEEIETLTKVLVSIGVINVDGEQ